MKKILILLILLLGVGCSAIPEMNTPEAKLYSQKCGSCHSEAHPGRHTAEQWENIVIRMEKEMKYKGRPTLAEDERKTILDYLRKHAR